MIGRIFQGLLMNKGRLILWAVIFIAGAGAIAGIWWHGHKHGVQSCEADMQAAVDAERAKQRELADQLEESRNARETRTRTVTRTIYREPDPTGCADSPALDGVLSALREDGDRPPPN